MAERLTVHEWADRELKLHPDTIISKIEGCGTDGVWMLKGKFKAGHYWFYDSPVYHVFYDDCRYYTTVNLQEALALYKMIIEEMKYD